MAPAAYSHTKHTRHSSSTLHVTRQKMPAHIYGNITRYGLWLKLNVDKTELLWAGSKYGSALLGSSGPSLQLGAETIKASDHVCLLGVTISSDLSLARVYYMCNVLLLAPSDPPNTSITQHKTLQRLLYMLSLRPVSTIVTPCWLGRQGPSPTGFNGCSTRLPEWNPELR